MSDRMTFPDTVEEFMEQYKVVDTDGVYMSKGAELVPIFRMKQWFEHLLCADDDVINLPSAQPEPMNVNLQVEKLSKHQSDFTDLDAQPEQQWIPVSERLPHGSC